MNPRDRVLAALELREPDRVPVVPFIITFAAKHAGIKFIDYCTKADKIVESQFKTANDFDIERPNSAWNALQHRIWPLLRNQRTHVGVVERRRDEHACATLLEKIDTEIGLGIVYRASTSWRS